MTQPKTFREKVVLFFNEQMSGKAIKPIKDIKNKRAEMLQARVREYGQSAVLEMISKAAQSSFLNGNNRHGFTATFDWMIRPNNFPKVWEGNYDDGKVSEETINNSVWQ